MLTKSVLRPSHIFSYAREPARAGLTSHPRVSPSHVRPVAAPTAASSMRLLISGWRETPRTLPAPCRQVHRDHGSPSISATSTNDGGHFPIVSRRHVLMTAGTSHDRSPLGQPQAQGSTRAVWRHVHTPRRRHARSSWRCHSLLWRRRVPTAGTLYLQLDLPCISLCFTGPSAPSS